jgi:hypothetical protein
MQRRTVNARQFEVLKWIADGCPEGVMSDTGYKTTAIALRNRGLTTVSKRGGWHAMLTDAGRYFLEHGDYPGRVEPTAAQRKTPKPHSTPKHQEGAIRAEAVEPSTQPAAPAAPEPVVRQQPERAVNVPERLVKPHPLVVELRERGRFEVSKACVPRVLRVVHALALAFEKEGWTVHSVQKSYNRWGHAWDENDLFVVDTGEHKEGIRFREENDRTPHVPTAYEIKEKERYSWTRIPEYDYRPSGRLSVEIHSTWEGRRHRWADRQRWRLEDKLGQLVDEIESRHQRAREERIKREVEEAEKKRQAELAIEFAKVELRESHREQVLLQEVDAWNLANRIRDYLNAMERRITHIRDSDEAGRATEWLQWCRNRTKRIDPLDGHIGVPDEPEATMEALRPFLPPWVLRGL